MYRILHTQDIQFHPMFYIKQELVFDSKSKRSICCL